MPSGIKNKLQDLLETKMKGRTPDEAMYHWEKVMHGDGRGSRATRAC